MFSRFVRRPATLPGFIARPNPVRCGIPARLSARHASSNAAMRIEVSDGQWLLHLPRTAEEGSPVESHKISKTWLRDQCRCSECTDQITRQRKFNVLKTTENQLQIHNVRNEESKVMINWADGHKSVIPWSSFRTVSGPELQRLRPLGVKPKLWNAKTISEDTPEVSFDSVMDDSSRDGMAKLTQNLMERGICFVHSTPPTPEATQRLLEKIGPIRNTHYGGFYDFVPDLALKDTAYTNEALAPHTDTTYFTEPAGLQSFHMLSHQAAPGDVNGSSGGLSIFVDGFNAVSELYKRDPEAVKRLMQYPIPWHASGNDGISITPDNTYPVIEGTPQYVHRVRWNNDDRGSLSPSRRTNHWYKSARVWQMILDKPENQFQLQLEPGRVVIFNNWRVMHGRTAFTGIRRMCGAYINRDDFVSRWKMSNFAPDRAIQDSLNRSHRDGQSRPNKMYVVGFSSRPEKSGQTVRGDEDGLQL